MRLKQYERLIIDKSEARRASLKRFIQQVPENPQINYQELAHRHAKLMGLSHYLADNSGPGRIVGDFLRFLDGFKQRWPFFSWRGPKKRLSLEERIDSELQRGL